MSSIICWFDILYFESIYMEIHYKRFSLSLFLRIWTLYLWIYGDQQIPRKSDINPHLQNHKPLNVTVVTEQVERHVQ